MNKSHVKGAFNELKGKIKEEVGHKTGNESLEGSGLFDRTKGKIQKGFGNAKDALKRKVDAVLDRH